MFNEKDESALIGKPYLKYIAKESRRKVAEDLQNAFQGDFTVFESVAINGCVFHTSLVPIKDEGGTVLKLICISEDITERKRMEAEILRAQKLESIGILAGGIAHDFNNILTAILGNTELAIIMAKDNPAISNILKNIEKASIKAKDLTLQLLTFSKGGAPVKKIISLPGLLREIIPFTLRGSNILCEYHIADDLWPVLADEGQISQVINNLIINASHSMLEGGNVEVVAKNMNEKDSKNVLSLKRGKYVEIQVKDHGFGISEDNISKIFDPYFTTKQKGSGLGLASAYSIITKHGGLIRVESEVDTGSTFFVYLPSSDHNVTKKDDESNKQVIGNGKVLVMDDDEMIGNMLMMMLSKIGYEVGYAKDGNEAIDAYKKAKENEEPFDVVLDLTIPGGMGGKDAISKLHESEQEAKAVVYSGYSNDPVMANFKKYGFKGVLTKPFKANNLNTVLQKVING